MNASLIEQMGVPDGITCIARGNLENVNPGFFVALPSQERKLFFVAIHGHCQVFFPLLLDGTISNHGMVPPIEDYFSGAQIEVFLADQIPGLKIVDNKIVWAE